jgi:hypothetical protein
LTKIKHNMNIIEILIYNTLLKSVYYTSIFQKSNVKFTGFINDEIIIIE